MIREKIAPFATPDFIQSAPGLPKTRSGKIMRRVLKKIANNDKDLGDISTMADSSVVEVGLNIKPNHLQSLNLCSFFSYRRSCSPREKRWWKLRERRSKRTKRYECFRAFSGSFGVVGGRIRAFHSQLQIVEISDKHKITYSLFVINNYCYRIWNCKITYCNLLLFDLINRQCILYTVSR